MKDKAKLIVKYLKSLSGILILYGILLLLISGFWDWHSLIENFGLAFTAAGITTFLFKFEIYPLITDDNLRQSGIEKVTHGRNPMFESVGSLEDLLRKSRPKEIDFCGIAMYSLFEPNNLYDLTVTLASEGYKIRIIFAYPDSPELFLQEEMEHKPGALKYHIQYLIEALKKRIGQHKNPDQILSNLKVGYSKMLPKEFILRTGNQMIVSKYFYRGPHFSPTLLLKDVPGGIFNSYRQYLDDIMERSFIEENLINKS
jgi:hypothetical protein